MTNSQRGGLLAVLGTAVVLIGIGASEVRLGFGVAGDVAIGLLVFTAMALGYGYLIATVVRFAHEYFTEQRAFIYGFLFAGAALMGVLAGLGVVRLLAAAVLFTAGWWGATIATFVAPDRRGLGRRPYLLLSVSVLLTLAVVNSAIAPFSRSEAAREVRDVPRLVDAGPLAVSELRYGSGADARRDDRYGSDAAIATPRVDLTAVLPGHHGVRRFVHARYWGIDIAAAPVNATVWLPAGTDRVPVALLLHGAGTEESSELGLAYLAEPLASHGIAAVGIDANFLSGPWIQEGDGAVAARERLVLAHLAALDSLDRDPRSPLAGRVDRSRLILIGHSRGGEAMTAVAMNHGRLPATAVPTVGVDSALRVRAVIALSPTEGLLLPNGRDLRLENISYLLIRGSQDADVPPEAGAGQYSRITWADDSTDFKSAVVIEGANHSQFNARWNRRDIAPPLGWLLRDEPVLDGRLQRELAAATVLAFLEDVLDEQPGSYRHFQSRVDDFSARSGVPIRRRIASARSAMLESFETDADPFRADRPGIAIAGEGFGIWREWQRRRTGNTMVQLVWPAQRDSARYTMTATSDRAAPAIRRGSELVFAAVGQSGEQDIRVEVETRDGRRTSAVVHVDADPEFSQRSQRYRSQLLEGQLVLGTFPSLHTYSVPLDSLGDGALLRTVRFVTPAGRPGAVMLDDIGIRPPQ
jgi:predicted esterase